MGKLTMLAGIFLGFAVTFAVMHFLVPKGISQNELKDNLAKAEKRAQKDKAVEKDAEWTKRLADREAKLDGEHKKALGGRDAKLAALTAEKKDLLGKAEEAKEELARLVRKRAELEAKIAQLLGRDANRPTAPKNLLVRRMALMDARVALWRTLGEVASVLTQAEIGWPDVAGAGRASKDIAKLVEHHAKLSRSTKVFVEENSKELGAELGDRGLKALRASVSDEYVKGIENLAGKVRAAVTKMRSHATVVDAKKDGWTDTEVVVERGDFIHVRADGVWRMIAHWQMAGPAGWDGGGQHRITHDARTGSLIMRIGVSEKIFPAYLGKPITADIAGRVVFRMNDKDVAENGGSVKVQVASANPAALRAAVAVWKKLTKKPTR
ncbi:MAG: hypothetical protein ACYTFI_05220 [Planctomycetota bacterium]|jgi:hypothetical protein